MWGVVKRGAGGANSEIVSEFPVEVGNRPIRLDALGGFGVQTGWRKSVELRNLYFAFKAAFKGCLTGIQDGDAGVFDGAFGEAFAPVAVEAEIWRGDRFREPEVRSGGNIRSGEPVCLPVCIHSPPPRGFGCLFPIYCFVHGVVPFFTS